VAVVGKTSLIMATVEVDGGHVPLVIVHWNTLVPIEIPVTPELGEDGIDITPVPESKLQTPVPITGELPANVAVPIQIVCVEPALATVGY